MDLKAYSDDLARRARSAARAMATTRGRLRNDWLHRSAKAIEERGQEILTANERDIANAPQYGLTSAEVDRLRLTTDRLRAAAQGLREVTALPDPVGCVLESNIRPNGLLVNKVSVPMGVIFFIYESRPNVTLDAAALCVKSGNAIILRGGKEAIHSNTALHRILQDCLTAAQLPADAVQLVTTTEREVVVHLLRLEQWIDLVIPRGGESLIRRVAEDATMPVLKHYQGICHVYIDKAANLDMAERILLNAKCQRPGVCNAAECVLIHQAIADTAVPRMVKALRAKGVEVRGCGDTRRLAADVVAAKEEDYRTEYLDLVISMKVVEDLEDAINHIARYGSAHTETIVTGDLEAAERFTAAVDSSAVLVNASTRFNDGFEFGLGAEIGISTDRFHARGPCGLRELCTYKYVVHGQGQVRE